MRLSSSTLFYLLTIRLSLEASGPCLIVILADGIRRDYIEEEDYKGFKYLRENGVEAEYLRPVFPSNSYPNWYTIATGKYAESHGFVGNYMYDRERNDYFLSAPPKDDDTGAYWWNQTEPIWITAEKQGVRTGMYWWDGCQVEIDGVRPTECIRYKSYRTWISINNDVEKQLSKILERMRDGQLRLAMVYYEPVDGEGHLWGPDSQSRKIALRNLDAILCELQKRIVGLHLDEKVNVVVVSDHGMTKINIFETKTIQIANAVEKEDIEVMLDFCYFSMIWPMEGKEEKVYNDLKAKNMQGLHVYRKQDIPEIYHLRNNRLTAPIVLTTDKNYILLPYPAPSKVKPYIPLAEILLFLAPGVHGFDPYSEETTDMRTIFYASGPSFKKNFPATPMEMVDIYNVFCYALRINPLPNNGSWDRVKELLVEESDRNTVANSLNK